MKMMIACAIFCAVVFASIFYKLGELSGWAQCVGWVQ